MAQLKCIVCGKVITGKEKVCPVCGAWIIGQKDEEPAPNAPKPKVPSLKVLIVPFIALLLVAATVYWLSTSNNEKEGEQDTLTEQADVETPATDGKDETSENTVDVQQTEKNAISNDNENASYPDVAGTYKGKIRTPTVIRLKQEGSRLFGTIRYTKFDSPALDINGTIKPDGHFELTEIDEDHHTPSGHITGHIHGNTMTATFRNPRNNKSTDFELKK